MNGHEKISVALIRAIPVCDEDVISMCVDFNVFGGFFFASAHNFYETLIFLAFRNTHTHIFFQL